jgi:hypothetical protein
VYLKLKKILKAALKFRNISSLIIVTAISALLEFNSLVLLAGFALYILLIIQTYGSEKFRLENIHIDKIDEINKMSEDCDSIYRKVCRRIDKRYRDRAVKVLKQKDELMKYFAQNNEDHIKQKIIEQAIKLVTAYLNLIYHYSIRSAEVSSENIEKLTRRIDDNNRKLGTLKNYEAVLEMTKTIEMDEKLLARKKEEKEELELVSVKLDHIESTIGAFKYQMLSSRLSYEESEQIEDIINEATALDSVLTERARNKVRI